MVKYIGYCCVHISLTKNAYMSILKTSKFRTSCLSHVEWLDFLFIHSQKITVHLPVEAQRPSTSMGLNRTAFLVRWRSLDNVAIMSFPRTLSVSGAEWRSGLAWTLGFCAMIGGSAKDWVAFDWQRFWTIKRCRSALQSADPLRILQASRKANCNLFIDICLAKLLDNFHRTFHTLINTIPCFSLTYFPHFLVQV